MASANPIDTGTGQGFVFSIRDCALIAIATGAKALTLTEFRNELSQIHPGSIYYHFWGWLLQPRFEEHEYNNDFAAWVRHNLHDAELAERLAVIDPTEFDELEDLRREIIEIIEQHLDDNERLQWQPANQPFEFIQSQIVVFDTHARVAEPEALAELLPRFSIGSVFYHFIDARRRSPSRLDDFSAWLADFGNDHASLLSELAGIDPHFSSLVELRQTLAAAFARHFDATAS
ncbi:MAG: DUF5752 family protein [Methylomonas sp.]